jgi:hypothetical protein
MKGTTAATFDLNFLEKTDVGLVNYYKNVGSHTANTAVPSLNLFKVQKYKEK